MKKTAITVGVLVAVAAALVAYTRKSNDQPAAPAAQGATQGGRGGGFGGGGFGGRGGRAPLTVELGKAYTTSITEEITVVGNLIGDATVAVAPRTAGRLQAISVRLGDRISRGQRIAKIEDFEIAEQVKQAEAAQQVAQATIRQREADLKLAETNVDRSRNLFERQLLPKQTLDDNEARYQSAVAQLDLARAQNAQSKARLDELQINLANTIITSPVNGFVAKRNVDPGAFVSNNAPILDVVDITRVRLVANVVEKDLKQLQTGDTTRVAVDAYPGETFTGRIARVSPVLDPATRTAPIEIEIPNPDFRLKPGMYARVGIVTDVMKNALVVPANAVVDLGGRRGIFQALNGTAVFRAVQVGAEQQRIVEILSGVTEGEPIITTGAGSLRDGDRIVLAGAARGARGAGSNAAARQGTPAAGARGTNGVRGEGSGRRFGGGGVRGGGSPAAAP